MIDVMNESLKNNAANNKNKLPKSSYAKRVDKKPILL